jgi:hypothetical protein
MPILRPGDPEFARLRFPTPGTKLLFTGANEEFWFTNLIENAQRLLTEGETYTLQDIEVYSSWARVTLAEIPAGEFPLSFFKYDKPKL